MSDQTASVEGAQRLLMVIGMDTERSNARSAMVLLALLHLEPGRRWSEAQNPTPGTRLIMKWIREKLGVDYKPNTRETIRRFTLHQFVQGHIVIENPDQPDRPKNSPKWCYQVTDDFLALVQKYGTSEFDDALVSYLLARPSLQDQYRRERDLEQIPITLPSGQSVNLSAGGQNVLLQSMLEDFCPRFTPGGEVLYIGDAGAKWLVLEEESLADIGVSVDSHGKMPDLVVYMPDRNWLVLMEAASTHGPVDHKRYIELNELFADCTAGLVFISCFPDQKTMRGYLTEIAWETEVWSADHPTHMIHFNGERFLGPYDDK